MKKLYQEQAFYVAVHYEEDRDGILGFHRRELWLNAKGEFERAGGLPPICGYEHETDSLIYRAWPDKNGLFRPRAGNKPSEIFDVEHDPHMRWYDERGVISFIAEATRVVHSENTGKIIEFIYDDPPMASQVRFKTIIPPSLDF